MMPSPCVYVETQDMQLRDAKRFAEDVLPLMDWSAEDVVMDVGCGPGTTTRNVLLPAFPDVKAVVGVDVLPACVEFARKECPHPKISYHVADIGDRSSLTKWQGEITKVVSIYCLMFIKDHRKAFENIYSLLKPGGEAAILFASNTSFWDSYQDLVDSPKWNVFLRGVDHQKSVCCSMKNRSDHYRKMLEDVGFEVVLCEDGERTYAFGSDAQCKKSLTSRCALTKYIPLHMMQEFHEEIFDSFLRHSARTKDGRPQLNYTAMTLWVKSPLQ